MSIIQNELLRTSCFEFEWNHDDNIILVRVYDRWSWDDAYTATEEVNRILAANVERNIYTIWYFEGKGASIPSHSALPNLKRMLSEDKNMPNEVLMVFVGNTFVIRFLELFSQVLSLKSQTTKIRVASTLDAAIKLITKHKSSTQQNLH